MHRTPERTQMRNRRSQTETEERVNEPLPHLSTASLSSASLAHSAPRRRARRPHPDGTHVRTHIANPRGRLLASARTEQRVPTDASTTPCRHSRLTRTPTEDWADAHGAPRDARPCALENVRGRPLRHLHAMRHECAPCAMNAPVWVRQATRRSQHASRAGGICEAVRVRRQKGAETISRRNVRRSRSEG